MSSLATGEFIECLEDDAHPSPKRRHEPECTRSQYVTYWNAEAIKIIAGHRYLLSDGSIWGSHRIDPKWIFHEGVIYQQIPKLSRTCL